MLPSSTSLAGRLARLPLRLIPPERPMPILSGALRGQRWIPAAGTHGCWLGWFEKYEQEWFRRLVRPGSVVYDIGACVGFYSLLASSLVKRDGLVMAFEPLPRNLAYLRRHLSLNACENVRVVSAAVADRVGTARFSDDASPSQNALSENERGIVVDVVTVDSIASAERPPDLLKIDVEGAEGAVLEGARKTLATHRPQILLSLHTQEGRAHSLAVLNDYGYRCTSMTEDADLDRASEWYAVAMS